VQLQGNLAHVSRGLSINPPEGAQVPQRHAQAPVPGTLLGSHNPDCYGCGASHPAGLHLIAYSGEGMTINAKFTVTELHQGAPGLAHGGLLSCAFDEALGKLMWLVRQPAVTGKLETSFVAPVPVGTTLFIQAEITGQEGRKIYCRAEGRIGSDTGTLAVEAAAIFIVVPMEHFISNAPEGFRDVLAGRTDLSIDTEFEINP
jgi:acyl-coenzyme A thioesterase PaaI-like protein